MAYASNLVSGLLGALCALAMTGALFSPVFAQQLREEAKDTDGNGKPDRAQVDRNQDGKPDIVLFYKEGKPDRQQADLNFDGKVDSWTYFKNGLKDLAIMDKNYDGKPDAWFYYGQAGLKLIGGIVDENFDGKPDRTWGSVPKEENRQPW